MAEKNRLIRLSDSDNTYVCPVTKSDGVFMSDGNTTLTTKMNEVDSELSEIQANVGAWNDFKVNGGNIGVGGYLSSDSNGLIVGKADTPHSYVRVLSTDSINSLSPDSDTMTLGYVDKPWKTLYLKTGRILSPASASDANLYIQANDGSPLVLQTKSASGVTGDLVLINNTSELCFRPTGATGAGKVDLGNPTVPFKDIYLNGTSKATNGYTKLSNGLILQWGQVSTTSGTLTEFNYPIAFPNANLNILATLGGGNGYDNMGVASGTRLLVGGYVLQRTGATRNICWMAIGY